MSILTTIVALFLLSATIAAIVSAVGRCPLWVSVVLLCIVVWLVTFGK